MQFDNYSIKNFNSFGIDSHARIFFSYSNIEDLKFFLETNFRKDLPFFILGGGCNVLFTKDFDGTIIHPQNKGIKITEETDESVFVKVAAGEKWDDFVEWSVSHNLYGAENLSFIPGTVGASPVQNIGAYGTEAGNIIDKVYCISIYNQQQRFFTKEECKFGYRDSIFKHEEANKYIVTDVVYKLQKQAILNLNYGSLRNVINETTATLQDVRNSIINIRKEKLPDPSKIGNAGSFFKNPVIDSKKAEELKINFPNIITYPATKGKTKIAAGWLIDFLGFKGFKIGGAKVHEKQALVLTNAGNATSNDILNLANHIQEEIFKNFGIKIEPEVIYL